jgi:hypothetical protein
MVMASTISTYKGERAYGPRGITNIGIILGWEVLVITHLKFTVRLLFCTSS